MVETFVVGTAGQSAVRHRPSRRASDLPRPRTSWGRPGGLAAALKSEGRSTRPWDSGASAESRVATVLESLGSESVRVLRDVRLPGARTTIDHLVVTPRAIWVIDTKRYAGRRPAKRIGRDASHARVETLTVSGWDRSEVVERVLAQADAVRASAGDIAVIPVLCFVDAEWPLIGGTFQVSGVDVLWPKKLAERIRTDRRSHATHDASALARWDFPAA